MTNNPPRRAPRPRIPKTCTICGASFQGVAQRGREDVAYCSRKCRDRAWYVAHGDERKRPGTGEQQ